jgi:1,4-alpha-glucan branching enzyme
VVHGKLSLINKQHGSYEDKFKGIRLFMAHMMAHPGKKLMFMGCEYGQFREWDYENQLEWFMLDYETHRTLKSYTANLNHFYLEHNALWQDDFSWDGFKWLVADDADTNFIAYERIGKKGQKLICVFNFSGAYITNYKLTLPDGEEMLRRSKNSKVKDLKWKCAFFTEDKRFGGGYDTPSELIFKKGSALVSLPPLSAAYYVAGSDEEIEIK